MYGLALQCKFCKSTHVHLQMRKKVAEANERIRKAESDREMAESTVIAVS